MSNRVFILAGNLSVILVVATIWLLGFQGQDTSAVDQEVTRLVKAYDNAIYVKGDRKAAKDAAHGIVALADQSSYPNRTKARGIIRLAYANVSMGKWDATWREKVRECESLISDEPTVARAEILLYSGHLIGKWGKHEFEAGLARTEEGRRVAYYLKDDRALALGYAFSNELQMFLDRVDAVTLNAYRAVLVANSYGEKSIRVVTLRKLLSQLIYLKKIPEAAKVGEMLLKIRPNSIDPLYPMFATGKSSKLEEYVKLLVERFEKIPVGTPGRRLKRARLGKMLTKLGRAYAIRKEFLKSSKTLEQAIPHIKAGKDNTTLKTCLAYLRVSKLEFVTDVGSVDKIAATTEKEEANTLFTEAIAKAYAKLGEREKSLDWRERAIEIRADSNLKEISHSQQSSELIWESEINLRKNEVLNNRIAAESQSRIWLLSLALTIGLTSCTLLSCFYYLSRRKGRSLEDVVEERTKSLNEAMQKANAADLAKSDFLAQINHEIRNPLTAILGYCELLSLEEREPNEFVTGIESSSLHLRELVDKILEVSKIEASSPEVQLAEFPPNQTTKDICGIMLEKARKKGLHLECTFTGDSNCLISSDETKIRQIGLNLVGNAIKFTEEGSVNALFELRTSASSSQAELVIEVSDTGIGIAGSELESVFDRFTKAGEEARDGSGLGLFIIKRLVECLAGEITLESTLGVGTQVRVVLPVDIADVSSNATSIPGVGECVASETPMESGRRILVVDDQEIIRNTLDLQFQAYRLECKTEWELDRTIEQVENWEPDLVLLDLRMPNLSGFEVLEEIRKSSRGDVAVYAMTGDATVPVQQKCLSVGFDGFITKPFSISSVMEILEPESQVA